MFIGISEKVVFGCSITDVANVAYVLCVLKGLADTICHKELIEQRMTCFVVVLAW